jgi:RimJ/RimL family protein N-acetyltransferase
MFYIQTQRLRLIPLDLPHLLLLKENRAAMERSLGLEVSAMAVDPFIQKEIAEALEGWITNVTNHPREYRWYTCWEIVLRKENKSVGGIGFTNLPDEHGESTIGYSIDKFYQRRGLASEAVTGLLGWAFQYSGLKRVLAETAKDNFASQRVLIKNGFLKCEINPETFLWEKEPEWIYKKNKQLSKAAV